MKSKTKPIFYSILVIGVLAALAVTSGAKPVLVQSVTVETGPVTAYVEDRAMTSLPRVYHITMPIQGRILPIALEEGDRVEKGQEVARIEDFDWKDATVQVEEMVKVMQNYVAAATAQVKASRTRTDFTKWVWEANQGMPDSGISERERRESKWQYLDSEVKTEEAVSNRHAAEAMLVMTDLVRPLVARNLARTAIISPVSGTVLKRHVWNEKVMSAGMDILEIGDLDSLEVTAEILTEEAVHIQEGDRVEIRGESLGDSFIGGTVRRIEPRAFTKLSSLGVEQQRVNVDIRFDADKLASLRQSGFQIGLHYRVRVRIITDEKPETLRVARTALFRGEDGGWQCFRIHEGRAERRSVEIGLANDHTVEITQGLAAGDRLIDAPEASIEDGVRVK